MAISNKNLYLANGYINMPEIISEGYPFTIIIAGRGTGKTYGILCHMIDTNTKFIYMRRTDTQIDNIANPTMNIFNWINEDRSINIYPHRISKGLYGYYNSVYDEEKGKYVPAGECLGLLAALSTLSNKRGFSANDIDAIILDEFCPESHERALKNESTAIFNCYETINRNRELTGRKPVQCIMLANSNALASETLVNFGLVRIITQMHNKGAQIYKNDKRGMLVICPNKSPISAQKETTALYKLINGGNYAKMAIENEFTDITFYNIKSLPINEHIAIVTVGAITIYKHKAKPRYYVSKHKSGSCPNYEETKTDLIKFNRIYRAALFQAFIDNKIIFENEECQILFTNYIK